MVVILTPLVVVGGACHMPPRMPVSVVVVIYEALVHPNRPVSESCPAQKGPRRVLDSNGSS